MPATNITAATKTSPAEIRTAATEDARMSDKSLRFQQLIVQRFNQEYGAAFKAGVLGGAVVSALIRSIGYTLIVNQDDSIDLNNVVPYIESAVDTLVHHPRFLIA